MESNSDLKALYIIVNSGFANDVMEIARGVCAIGATIINARGENIKHEQILGITIDSEKEIILSLVDKDVSEKIMDAVKEKAGIGTPAHGICFVVPVDKTSGLTMFTHKEEK